MFHGAMKKNSAMFLWTKVNTLKIILFFNSSLASGKNKEYLIAVF